MLPTSLRFLFVLISLFKVLMTDPAVAYQPDQGYGTFDRGINAGIFLKEPNGSLSLGVVWPGVRCAEGGGGSRGVDSARVSGAGT